MTPMGDLSRASIQLRLPLVLWCSVLPLTVLVSIIATIIIITGTVDITVLIIVVDIDKILGGAEPLQKSLLTELENIECAK